MAIFNGKPTQDKSGASPEANLSLVAAGMHIVGNILAEGVMRVEGKIQGTVVCKSRLVIGTQGRIEGNIDTKNATIEGEVHGQVVVRDLLEIQASGKIYGDIVCEKFTMQAGGLFTGSCKMGPEAREVLSKGAPKLQASPLNLNTATEAGRVPIAEDTNVHLDTPAAKEKDGHKRNA